MSSEELVSAWINEWPRYYENIKDHMIIFVWKVLQRLRDSWWAGFETLQRWKEVFLCWSTGTDVKSKSWHRLSGGRCGQTVNSVNPFFFHRWRKPVNFSFLQGCELIRFRFQVIWCECGGLRGTVGEGWESEAWNAWHEHNCPGKSLLKTRGAA